MCALRGQSVLKREQKIMSFGKQALLSSRQKFARSGFDIWRRRHAAVAVMVASVLWPIEASADNWLSDMFKGSSKDVDRKAHV